MIAQRGLQQIGVEPGMRLLDVSAGLVDIDIHTVTETLHFTTGSEMWDWSINSHPLGIEVANELTHTQQDGLRQALDRLLRERAGGQGPAVLTHPVLLGTGTKAVRRSRQRFADRDIHHA